jgi:hypothetical protein
LGLNQDFGLVNAPALDDAFAWLMDLSSRTSTYPHPEPLQLMHQYRHDDRRDVERSAARTINALTRRRAAVATLASYNK